MLKTQRMHHLKSPLITDGSPQITDESPVNHRQITDESPTNHRQITDGSPIDHRRIIIFGSLKYRIKRFSTLVLDKKEMGI